MKVTEIRPANVMHGAKTAYQKDLEFYRTNHHLFTPRTCPAKCNTSYDDSYLKHDIFNFSRCNSCLSVYMNPGPTSEIIAKLYRTSSNYEYWAKYVYPLSKEKRTLLLSRPRAKFVFDAIKHKPKNEKLEVLEFGSGSGDVTMSLIDFFTESGHTAKLYAVEPNSDMEKFYLGSSIEFLPITFDEAFKKFSKEKKCFDIVFSYEVMEHLKDPLDCFEAVSRVLKPEGKFIFSTPNAQSLETMVLREKSTTFDIEHISILTPLAVNKLASEFGFSMSQVETPGELDLELISKYNKWASVTYKLMCRITPKFIARIKMFISENRLSSHSRFVLTKNVIERK